MKRLLLIISIFISVNSFSQPDLPAPDHIILVILENKAYHQIIGSTKATYINQLANSSNTALFTRSFGIEHPSQPNYLDLFSGCNQGVKNDAFPAGSPFTTANLARQLLDEGKTFITYSENLPQVGFNESRAGYYARKHNPAANWMGNGHNQIPADTNQPFTSFPTDFNLLPTVSFVIPNMINNMHDRSIVEGDRWIYDHLWSYIQWAKTHNSLFILTFDEDNRSQNNQIVTIFSGQMVKAGKYSKMINHYSVLRTIEEMYGLPYACNAATAETIADCWDENVVNLPGPDTRNISVYYNSTSRSITLEILNDSMVNKLNFELINLQGVLVKEVIIQSHISQITIAGLSSGVYIYQLTRDRKVLKKGKLMVAN